LSLKQKLNQKDKIDSNDKWYWIWFIQDFVG
jgi:hypothetical protein